MSFIDSKYIGLASTRLQKFKRVKNNLYNFRCPYCGDSQRNKNKARGYIYQLKNDHNYKCHNCGMSKTFTNFLKDLDSSLYDQYVMERYKNGLTGKNSNTSEPDFKFEKPVFKKTQTINLPTIQELNTEHPAKVYLKNRKIPDKFLSELYYCERFKEWTNEQKYTFESTDQDEPRIIIPLINKGELFGFQGRSLSKYSKIKYITIILDEQQPKIYGLNKVNIEDPIYIVEGPIDSIFIKNSVAMCGADVDIRSFGWSNYIWVFDNEPRNREIVNRISKTIDRGDKIVIWPSNIKEKDINDMVLAGLDVNSMIESNTYSGLEAKVKFISWKRV